MGVVETVRVVQMAIRRHFIIASELRPYDNGGILAEIGMPLDPVEEHGQDCQANALNARWGP